MLGLSITLSSLHEINEVQFWEKLLQSLASYYKRTQEAETIKLSKVFYVSGYQI